MEHESNTMGLCRSGCGFYGNPATDGLCSLCFKEALKKKQQPPSSAPSPSSPSANSSSVIVAEQAARNSVMETMATAQPTVPPCLSPNAPATTTEPAKISEEAEVNEAVGGASSAASAEQQQSADNSADENKDAKKKKNRCAMCRKKVGLTGFECRCGGLFCGVHRYSDKHDCTFDYREMGAQEIRRNNPVVVGEKMQKI